MAAGIKPRFITVTHCVLRRLLVIAGEKELKYTQSINA